MNITTPENVFLRFKRKKNLILVFHKKIATKKSIKKHVKEVDEKTKDEEKCSKTKLIIEFDPSLTCSITILFFKKKKRNKTTRFFNGKMLMFAKVLFITSAIA